MRWPFYSCLRVGVFTVVVVVELKREEKKKRKNAGCDGEDYHVQYQQGSDSTRAWSCYPNPQAQAHRPLSQPHWYLLSLSLSLMDSSAHIFEIRHPPCFFFSIFTPISCPLLYFFSTYWDCLSQFHRLLAVSFNYWNEIWLQCNSSAPLTVNEFSPLETSLVCLLDRRKTWGTLVSWEAVSKKNEINAYLVVQHIYFSPRCFFGVIFFCYKVNLC